MPATRRRFLGWLGLALAAGAVASWSWRESLRIRLRDGGFLPSPAGPLPASTAETLKVAVLALLEDRVDPSHYVDFFRWRARHLRGARAVYLRFEAALDRAARDAGAPGFRGAPREEQRRILAGLLPARGLERLRRYVLDRDRARFSRHVLREVFRLFARTDAWVLAGYDAWPGTPRAIVRWRGGEPAP